MKLSTNIYTEQELKELPWEVFIKNTDSYEVCYTHLNEGVHRKTMIFYGPNHTSHLEVAKRAHEVISKLEGKNIYIDSVNHI